ncbi:MAG TPA: Ig-like domain-containing protein, partial [archaeon]|nr:Ig-like domain-containing protein [archaeon]
MKKFIVLVICALIGMLSIPHITLWNFSVGSETVNAETTIGASCTESGKYSCSASSGQYVISSCIRGAWARWSGSTYPSLDACKAACNSGTYASNCIESPAVEPQYTLTNSISPSQPVIGSPLVIFSKVTSGSIQTNQIESHKIIWKVVKGSQTVVSETTNMCSTSYTDCQITISSSVPDSWNGATLNYRSEMKLYGGFTKLAPASGDDSVTIGSIQTPPNNKAQCPLPDTASVITCNTNQDCSNKINDCFIKSDSDLEYIAPACVSGKCKTIIGWAWTCTNGFDNNRCSGDAACLKFVSSAGFSNPYPEGKTFQQCSPGSAPPTSGTNTLNIQPTFYTIPTGTTYNFVAQGLASTDSIQLSGITFDNPAVASVSGINVKTITVRGNAVGTAAMTVTSSDSKTGTVNIAVGTGSGTSTSTNHCCIKKSGSSYTYENINPFQSTLCTELGNTYRPEPCVNAQNYACAQYCLDGGLGNNGNCNNLGNPTSPYYGICLNPTATPCVCSGPPSNANLPCESLCNTDSRVISVVNSAYSAQQIISASCQCTTNPSATNVMVQLPTAGSASNRQPIQLGMAGQNGCTNPQACWATFMTLASYSATTQTAATLPG